MHGEIHTVALEVASKHCTLVGFAHYTSAGFMVKHRPLTRVSGFGFKQNNKRRFVSGHINSKQFTPYVTIQNTQNIARKSL